MLKYASNDESDKGENTGCTLTIFHDQKHKALLGESSAGEGSRDTEAVRSSRREEMR